MTLEQVKFLEHETKVAISDTLILLKTF